MFGSERYLKMDVQNLGDPCSLEREAEKLPIFMYSFYDDTAT